MCILPSGVSWLRVMKRDAALPGQRPPQVWALFAAFKFRWPEQIRDMFEVATVGGVRRSAGRCARVTMKPLAGVLLQRAANGAGVQVRVPDVCFMLTSRVRSLPITFEQKWLLVQLTPLLMCGAISLTYAIIATRWWLLVGRLHTRLVKGQLERYVDLIVRT